MDGNYLCTSLFYNGLIYNGKKFYVLGVGEADVILSTSLCHTFGLLYFFHFSSLALVPGHFINVTFRQLEISSTLHFINLKC